MSYIERLPDEIINKIYCYLDVQSIKNFSQTCKRAANVLTSSSFLLNKHFKLKLHGDFWKNREKILDVLYLKRYLNEIEIANVAGSHNILNALFKKIGFQIVILRISASKIDDFTFRELLKFCPSLKEIHLTEVKIIKKLPAINPVCLSNLQHISVIYCDWEIFKFFTRSQIKILSIKSYLDEGHRKDILRFFSLQRKLKELDLHGTSLRAIFQTSDLNKNCSFELESLKIDNGFGRNSDIVNLNVITFMNRMDESLQNVEIYGPHNEDVTIYTLLHLNNIKSLAIDVRNLTKDNRFYEQLENEPKNECLSILKLVGFFSHQNAIKAILLKYPNVESLELYEWGNNQSISNLLNFLSENLLNLRSLKITEITNNDNIKLKALQKLSVQYMGNPRKLVNFMSKNSSIESLDIGLVYISQINQLGNDLKDLKNIKHLTIGGNKKALGKILSLIRTEAPKQLETLQFLIVDEKNESQKTVKINFPLNPIDMNFKFNVLI